MTVPIHFKLLLTINEAAALIGVDAALIRSEIANGNLPFKILPQRKYKYIRRADLLSVYLQVRCLGYL